MCGLDIGEKNSRNCQCKLAVFLLGESICLMKVCLGTQCNYCFL